MKIYENKKIWKKLVIALLIILAFQALFNHPVHADDDDDGWGGVLLGPVKDLFVALADAVMAIIQDIMLQGGR